MRYVAAALVTEGLTDDRFLIKLFERALEELCSSQFNESAEIGPVVPLRSRRGPSSIGESVDYARSFAESFNLLFYHHDQGNDAMRVEREWLNPMRVEWVRRGVSSPLVLVVPVRETEAWLLADGNALRAALGVRWTDEDLGVPTRARLVEKIADPKKNLEQIGSRLSRPVGDFYERIGEIVSMSVLRQVPAFNAWWTATREALTTVGFSLRTSR